MGEYYAAVKKGGDALYRRCEMISMIRCEVKVKQETAVMAYLQERDDWERDFHIFSLEM